LTCDNESDKYQQLLKHITSLIQQRALFFISVKDEASLLSKLPPEVNDRIMFFAQPGYRADSAEERMQKKEPLQL